MSQFKFSCPKCNQNISCNSDIVGERINCPNCLTLITVPQPPNPVTPAAPPASTTQSQKTSGLAIASLVCSLASLVTCIGWLPGIICGHIAKAKIRKNPALKGAGLATAGLVVGYLFFISEIGYFGVTAWRISSAVHKGFTDVQHNLATNTFITATEITNNTGTIADTNDMAQPEPAPDITATENTNVATVNVTTTTDNSNGNSTWTTDLHQMTIPAQTVGGTFFGNNFQFRRAYFRNGAVRIVSANRAYLEIRNLGATIDGKSYQVQTKDAPNAIPHLMLTWPEGVLEPTAFLTRGYAMKLEFGPVANGTTTGKIYVCLPDNSKSWLAGTFPVEMPKTN